jgi:hypothetical protein
MSTVGAIFLGVGALEVAIGVFLYLRTTDFSRRRPTLREPLRGFEESYSSDTGTSYMPVVEFTGADGEKRKFTDSMASDPPGYEVGETVPVKYDPADPEDARIAKRFRLWFAPALLGGMGVTFLIVGVILLALG